MRDVALDPARTCTAAAPAGPAERQAVPAAAVGAAGLAVVPFLSVLVPLLDGRESSSLVLGLALTGLVPLLAAGVAPLALVPGLRRGRREAVLPALLVGAGLGAVGVLAATLLPDAFASADPRLRLLGPYFAATMAGLGLSHVFVVQRLAAGAPRRVAVLAGLAAAVTLAQLAGSGAPTADDAVLAAFGGTLVLLVGVGAATVAAAPFSLRVARDQAGEGPRAVGLTLALAVAAGIAIRLAVAGRPAWLDDAAAARLAGDQLPGALERSLAQPHPPLQTVLEWLSGHLFGLSPLAVRLPSLLAGVLLVPAVYAAGAELYGRRSALVAALVTALGPGFVWLSADPGPAALTALLTAVGVFALVRALRRDRPADWALLGLAGAGLVLTHQLGLATVAVLDGTALVALLRRRRSRRPAPGATGAGGLALAVALTAAAAVPLLVARHGFGPAAALPPAEYATAAAPAGGGTPFGLGASALAGLVGFHPPAITSRLLALWPLGILAAFLVFGRRWSGRGLLLAGLVAAPFLALVLADLLGAPRQPPAALDWLAAALPALAIGVGRTVSLLGGPWRSARLVTAGLVAVLAVALADQTAAVRPVARLDLTPVRHALALTHPGDVVVYEPAALGDLVRFEAPDAQAVPVSDAAAAESAVRRRAAHVVVVAAFPLDADPTGVDRTVAMVKAAAATHSAPTVLGTPEVKSWIF